MGLAPLEPDPVAAILTGPRSGTARLGTFDASGTDVQSYLGYSSGYGGGVSVAMGDVNGDGVDDVVVGASTGVARVRVIDGSATIQGEVSGDAILADFIAFSTSYIGGVTVASGDVNGDGRDDVVVGAATGTAHVRVIEGRAAMAAEGEVDSGLLANFFAFPLTYTGGVNVAAGDVDGDGRADVVVGAATGVAHVRVFDGAAPPTGVAEDPADRIAEFFAYAASYSGGVNVAAGG